MYITVIKTKDFALILRRYGDNVGLFSCKKTGNTFIKQYVIMEPCLFRNILDRTKSKMSDVFFVNGKWCIIDFENGGLYMKIKGYKEFQLDKVNFELFLNKMLEMTIFLCEQFD
jgi:hypothetical protein